MLAIFDLDGTLLNTIADLAEACNYALEKTGFPTHSLDAYPYFVGNGVRRLLHRVLPEDCRTEENVNHLALHFYEYYGSHLTCHTVPYPGIRELLAELHGMGYKLAVASNKYQAAVTELIRYYFPDIEWCAVEGQKEGVPTKPDPSIVFEILAQAVEPKAQVLYIGDSGVDMDTARRAGVTSIGVTWGFRPESELTEHYADYIVSDTEALLHLARLNIAGPMS